LEELAPLGATATAGLAWITFGMILATQGETERALRAFEESARVRAELGDAVGEAQARGNVAIVLLHMSRPEQALAALQAASLKYRQVQHLTGVALSLFHMAGLGRESGVLTLEQRATHAR